MSVVQSAVAGNRWWVVRRCRFCGQRHEHGPWEGWKIALCPEGFGPKPVAVYFVKLGK